MSNMMQFFNPKSPILYLLIIWSIAWKGVALWYAARSRHLGWYIVLLVVNTAGILEIIYLIFFRKKPIRKHNS